jgi:hypothetical protein
MMKTKGFVCLMLLILSVGVCFNGITVAANSEKEQQPEQKEEAKAIDAYVEISADHPEFEEGVTCNDCHEIKLDAQTTATQVWLAGESPGRAAGEGVMPQDRLLKEIKKVMGGVKQDSKTYVLGTSLNNVPLTTTAEFTLDPEKMVLYGFHEMGTQKLIHIKANPKVSLNWHVEFETFTDFLCVQVIGHAELIDGNNKEFAKVMIDFLPYEGGARVPEDATPEQREKRLKQFRVSLMEGFAISKITIDQITIATMDFVKDGFRRYQRWTRP